MVFAIFRTVASQYRGSVSRARNVTCIARSVHRSVDVAELPATRRSDVRRPWRRAARQGRRPRAPVLCSGLEGQAQIADAAGDIETGVAFDADRLQRDRTAGAAHQHIGADADPDGGAGGGADISARQRARPGIGGRREHGPNHHRTLHIADIDAELVDRPNIMLRGAAAPRSKGAVDRPRGSADEAKAAGYVAVENAALPGLRWRRRSQSQGAARQADRDGCNREFSEHSINLLLAK